MNIRTATKEDIPAMAELLHQLFAIEADFTPDYDTQVKGLELLLQGQLSAGQVFPGAARTLPC